LVWSRLRLLDPTLLPWNLDEIMATKNPQVITKDHFMQNNCFGAFWTPAYSQETRGLVKGQSYSAWCREHQEWELHTVVLPQLLFQLGCNFLDSQDWLDIHAHRSQPGVKIADKWECSHGCGNGCRNAPKKTDEANTECNSLFCMFWESGINNGNRQLFHRIFRSDGTPDGILDDLERICNPRLILPCIAGR
jgi:hypothetical protein